MWVIVVDHSESQRMTDRTLSVARLVKTTPTASPLRAMHSPAFSPSLGLI